MSWEAGVLDLVNWDVAVLGLAIICALLVAGYVLLLCALSKWWPI